MARVLGICFLCFISIICFGQKEWSNWYFNGRSLLTFKNNNVPQVERNFITPAPPIGFSYYYYSDMGMSYSDPVTGVMKFVLGGVLAFDKNYEIINSPSLLRYCSGDKYGYHIIPFQNNPDKFYIIQFQSVFADMLAAQSGLQVRCPNAIGLGYSVLDLSLNNGLGNFTSMNNVIQSSTSEGISLVRHANGKDTWVIVHSYNDNNFYSYLFSDAGVALPVVTAIGPAVHTDYPGGGSGFISASHDGKTLAVRMMNNKFIELYDFDKLKGRLTSYKNVALTYVPSYLIFSPDDSKLYFMGSSVGSAISQMDFNAPNIAGSITSVADDPITNFFDMQLGPDGKIYISRYHDLNEDKDYLAVIRCPNLPKYACNYDPKGLELQFGAGKFPDLVNDFIIQPKAAPVTEFSLGNDTAICFGTYKLSAPVEWQHYRWNTGEITREINI